MDNLFVICRVLLFGVAISLAACSAEVAETPDAGVDAGTLPVDAGGDTVPDSGFDAGSMDDAGTRMDAGMEPEDAGMDAGIPDAGMPTGTPWLSTSANHIVLPDGTHWHGRGANLPDTRGCDACTANAPNVNEVKRRIDELVDNWHANFIRLTLESYATSNGFRVQYQGVLDDPAYLADIKEIVDYIGTKPGVYVLVSLWVDPSFDSMGWPTAQTRDRWRVLADTFKNDSQVLFGVVNEPQNNFNGAQDPQVWTAMNDTVAAIRDVEDTAGTPHHLIAVQGTGGWARRLDYYVTHPITAAGGDDIVYEVHVYNPQTDFLTLFQNQAATLPVIIGEFGPVSGGGATMTLIDCSLMMDLAMALEIPHLAWTFHMRCSPNLLVDNSAGGCGVNMSLAPTTFGTLLQGRLATSW